MRTWGRKQIRQLIAWAKRHKVALLRSGAGVIAVVVLVQIFYPTDRLMPFASVESVAVGGWQKKDATWELNELSNSQTLPMYFGENQSPRQSPKPAEIGLEIDHSKQIDELGYPWYMRLVPSSILWWNAVQNPDKPSFERNDATLEAYLKKKFDDSCSVEPKNASLKPEGDELVLVPSADGGVCEMKTVKELLGSVAPTLDVKPRVTVPVEVVKPEVSDEAAKQLADKLNQRIGEQVAIEVAGEKQTIPAKEVVQWLTFTPKKGELVVGASAEKADEFLNKEVRPKLVKPAGTTKVVTRDFTELSRKEGATGQTLDVNKTLKSVVDFVTNETEKVTAVPRPVAPKVTYSRSYTSTSVGISALMTHYSEAHAGTFGVSLVELSGQGRQAQFQGNKDFVAASTYKLFVAYGTLKKVESGDWEWSDEISGGRDLAACFNDMIVKSDNPCAEALLKKYGYNNLTAAIQKLGLKNSRFANDGPHTTANDLRLFLTKLENHQLGLKNDNADRLISAMKRNVYRQGIPAGTNGQVADKVGFLNGLLHDASIVYGSSGTYVLVVMTDGSSWGSIAELTRQIKALRS